jgi:X-X-X-Leu-X-X-Gly heptad repeat protein
LLGPRDTAAAERARREALDRELAAREAEARRREEELARVGAAEREARARAEELAVTVGAARREAELLQAQTVTLRETIEAERAERVRVQATTSELAAGVGQLAERSGQLAQEIRENRPLNANALFDDFLSRRVASRFIGERESFLGPVRREQQTHTVLVSDGQSSVALLHLDDTPFELLSSSPPDWRRLTLTLSRAEHSVTARQVAFASLDPRILLVALTPEESARLAPTPYLLALDPFKFPEAVLINAGGRGYGELPFKLDPARRGYVQVDNRLFRRLFGDFSPSRGDLVLSKTGELLGVMVSAETCALISHLLPSTGFPLGPELPPGAATPALTEAAKRLRLLQP